MAYLNYCLLNTPKQLQHSSSRSTLSRLFMVHLHYAGPPCAFQFWDIACVGGEREGVTSIFPALLYLLRKKRDSLTNNIYLIKLHTRFQDSISDFFVAPLSSVYHFLVVL